MTLRVMHTVATLMLIAFAILVVGFILATVVDGGQIQRFRVTAYCTCVLCCGPNAEGITASGTRADHPLVAGPPSLPFGTRLCVPNYAVGWDVRVEDRGGAIKGNRLDVFFDDHESAIQWGVQYLNVEIVRRP